MTEDSVVALHHPGVRWARKIGQVAKVYSTA